MSETVSVSEWFGKYWPILAMLGIIVGTVVFFGWLVSRPPPLPPYP